MPTEMLCSDEPSSVVSELFVTHEGMSKFPSASIPSPGVRREGQGRVAMMGPETLRPDPNTLH